MKYQDCAEALQADDGPDDGAGGASRLADANINPATGLATDYLNHFNEVIMLLEMLSSCSECRDDFLGWRTLSYRAHFAASRFKGRAMAIAADPSRRGCLDTLAGTMTAVLEATRAAMSSDIAPESAVALAERAAVLLRPLVARAGAVINGEDTADAGEPVTPQAVVDRLMKL
ncbi:MAG TPA: hypothetical protein VLN61_05480 [Pseudolabrys sp.]|nr:hypothetical protein [Pseudolabrys sp.]